MVDRLISDHRSARCGGRAAWLRNFDRTSVHSPGPANRSSKRETLKREGCKAPREIADDREETGERIT